ncbi:MAG: hypothetical protein Q8M15_02165 [Bacteroidota bacterium]|nr:hypothetical protein [Bacteroidota bacterium]
MNILIVDDNVIQPIKFTLNILLREFKLIEGHYTFFECINPDEADQIYRSNEIDMAFIDYDLNNIRTGLELDIVRDNTLSPVKKNVVFIISDYYKDFKPEIKNVINGFLKSELSDFAKQRILFKSIFDEFELNGKLVKLMTSVSEHGYIKTQDIILITSMDGKLYLYTTKGIIRYIYDPSVSKLFKRFKIQQNGLVQINKNTIVNKSYFKQDNSFFTSAQINCVNLEVTPIYKNIL